jgi:hypothetical protein
MQQTGSIPLLTGMVIQVRITGTRRVPNPMGIIFYPWVGSVSDLSQGGYRYFYSPTGNPLGIQN